MSTPNNNYTNTRIHNGGVPPVNLRSLHTSRPGRVCSGNIRNQNWSNPRPDLVSLGVNSGLIAQFFGRLYPRNTAQEVAAVTGVPESTLKKYLSGCTKWSSRALIVCIYHYGVDFLFVAMPCTPEWLVRCQRVEDRFELESARLELEVFCGRSAEEVL